jgi:hypothetical protein
MPQIAASTRFISAAIVLALGAAASAQASFVTTSPDPFPPGSGYVHAPGCIASGPLSGVCSSNVTGTILSASSNFTGGNQHTVLNELVTGDLSVGGGPIGSFSVTGPLDLTLAGRSGPNDTGTFTGIVDSEDYIGTGTIAGTLLPIEFTLDPSQTSTAQITTTPLQGEPPLFRIDSFFDIFSQISIEGGAPIPIGGFPITGVAAPEPATLALLGLPLVALAGLRRRRAG